MPLRYDPQVTVNPSLTQPNKQKLLLVTFPVDLGNQGFEKRFIKLFEDPLDLKVYRFNPNKAMPKTRLDYLKTIGQRAGASFELHAQVRAAYKEGRQILFHGISPALFAYPVVKRNTTFIVTDWTRKLYEPIKGVQLSSSRATKIHRKVLEKQKGILCLTEAVNKNIVQEYGISQNRVFNVRLPFHSDLEAFTPENAWQKDKVRLLFVGGDFARKGGDMLLDWFNERNDPKIHLTMLTPHKVPNTPNLVVRSDVRYGDEIHKRIFQEQDLFVLPTRCDSYPTVLGEAACAGLGVITTKEALGAPEVIQKGENGYICHSPEDFRATLNRVVDDRDQILTMRVRSRKLMEEKFAAEIVLQDYVSQLFQTP